ncbi:error-prone DNA polymerase [Candidatus Halocynthiibacter alkanivorans]|uniref:error-prone DNA polymerase n=1 Tax=Candidatus Halocynthiibacter alkanivorans TaxID=2267619 RepID=UPI003012A957
MTYAELCVTSNFTFLTGASHPEELVTRAAALGLAAIAITDRNSLAGVVRAYAALKELKRQGDEAIHIRSQHQVDSGCRMEISSGPGVARPQNSTQGGNAGGDAQTADQRGEQTRSQTGARARDQSRGQNAGQAGGSNAGRTDGQHQGQAGRYTGGQNGDQGGNIGGRQRKNQNGNQAGNQAGGQAGGRPGTQLSAQLSTRPGTQGVDQGGALSSGRGGGPTPAQPSAQSCVQSSAQPGIQTSARGGGPAAVQASTQGGGRPTSPASAPPTIPPSGLPRLIIGCRLVLRDSPVEWLALPRHRAAYARLSRLLTLGKRRAKKGDCHLDLHDLLEGAAGIILIALPADAGAQCRDHIRQAANRFPGDVYLGAAPRYDGGDPAWFDDCARLARHCAAPMVALGDVLMHHGSRRRLADVLTCMRHHITIDQIGTLAQLNSERRLKSGADMARLFRDHPAAVRRSVDIAARCNFCLSELSYEYPDEVSKNESPQQRLTRLSYAGLERRYPEGLSPRVQALVEKELALVGKLGFAAYFLTVHDIVSFARGRGILCQGRGSAANSVLCYALGITDVGPDTITMVFERFISEYREEPPDIDVDFEHERREEVIQHIYETYGRHRAGLCATVIHFRSRAAIREVGKVMGLSQDVTAGLSGQIWGLSGGGVDMDRVRELGLDPEDTRLALTLQLIGEIIGFPRHLSQHVGGFIMTRGRLDELCPIENAAMEDRTTIEWDKDDIDALGILKVDVLSLGMLTCIRKCFDLIEEHGGARYCIASVPQEDTATYDMLCIADAVGVFQVESRAQMNFLPRMQPREFYDLVIEVAIVRPGPIQGGMVHPYINRRQGREPVHYPSAALEQVLGKTMGVPLFQEQAMQIAVVGAGFTPEEADRLRRSLATFRRMGTIGTFKDRFTKGMLERGYDMEFAERCFGQIEGFGEYGFPESHAAAFAMLAYVSAWLKCHHPAAFACALLNSQPMGFYAPAQIVRDARDHQIELRPVCVNNSGWDNHLERRTDGSLALRLGFRQIKGFREEAAGWIVAARGNGYPDPESLWQRAGIKPAALERLAEADAFADMGLGRRNALWRIKAIRSPQPLPLFNDPIEGESIQEPAVTLPSMHLGQEVVEDYVAMRLSLRAHPMELLRPDMPGLTPHAALVDAALRPTMVCGLVITRQRPGTASGVVFLTLEDETGVSNVIVWPKVYEQFRREVMGGRLLRVSGVLQREGIVVHLIAQRIEDCSELLAGLGHPGEDAIGETLPQADDVPKGLRAGHARAARHPRDQAKALFPSRDFH